MEKVEHIPEEIAADIVSRLPSKSLLRFKAACKTWYASISDSDFIKVHAERASENPKILFSTGSHLQILDYERSFGLSDPIPFPDETSPFHPLRILGSSQGLVCLASSVDTAITNCENHIFVWNPMTGETKKIPFWWPPVLNYSDYLHGFCYDPVSDDFVLVISKHSGAYCYISFKNICWNIISSGISFYHLTFPVPSNSRPVTTHSTELNGVLHWIATPDHIYGHYPEIRIMSFDLAKRKAHEQMLKVPPSVSSSLWSFRTSGCAGLFEHRGCLCLYYTPPNNNRSKEIWIMEKYGDNNSWVHLLTIENSLASSSGFDFRYARIICISSRDVILRDDRTFIRYRSKEGKFDEEAAIRIQPPYVNSASLYVDTLVSPYL